MIVEFISALIEQDIPVSNNHDELVSLCYIIHDTVLIFWFWQRKYVRDAPVVKPDSSKPDEGYFCPDDPCSFITVEMDKSSTCC